MDNLERVIPNENKAMVVRVLTGHDIKGSPKRDYLTEIQKFERKCEKSLIETLGRIGVKATVKTKPYSLPYKDELVICLLGESYMNGSYEFYRVAREIVKELLDKNVYHIRFYLFINVEEGNMGFGKVNYSFRYYISKYS